MRSGNHIPCDDATDFDGVKGYEYRLTYNNAGSLVSDAGRKIAKIEFDSNNIPTRIQFTNGNVTKYVYSATGEKLRVIYTTAMPRVIKREIGKDITERLPEKYMVSTPETVDYLLGGALTLRNGRIDKYQFEEGYCQAIPVSNPDPMELVFTIEDIEVDPDEAPMPIADNFEFYYYDRDHLGNIRQVTKDNGFSKGDVVQTVDYYPFGGEFCDKNSKSHVQNHKYNGKEFDNMHGLNTYDYGARQYNPVTGRWDRMDPLCEKYLPYSPYNYCLNNPVKNIDPDGCRSYNVVDPAGNIRTEYIDDGIDETYDIQECDFTSLQEAYNLQQNNNEGQYDTYFNSLGLGTSGYKVACKARQLERENPKKYALNSDAGDGHGFVSGTYKCNKFAYDVLTSTGVLAEVPKGKPYPQAEQYAGEKCIINGALVSCEEYQPRLGDVIGGAYPFTDATGHVEIVTRTFPNSREFKSTGAHSYGLGTTSMGYKMVNKQNVSNTRKIIYNPVKVSRPN